MIFRFRYAVQGDHTHVRLFAGKGTISLGLCGSLAFRNEEWQVFRSGIERTVGSPMGIGHECEFVEEGEDPDKNGTGVA